MNWIRRMLFAWLRTCANEALLKAELAGAAHWTRLSRLSTSMRALSVVPLPVWNAFETDRSTLLRQGE